MANYLRPRRGKKATAIAQNIILKRGEVFFEAPDSGIGTGAGKIKIGDGTTTYKDLPYFLEQLEQKTIDVANTAIVFTTNSSTDNATLLNAITSGTKLNVIIGAMKKLLSLLNNDLKNVNNGLNNVNKSLGDLRFGKDANGNYGYIKAGADTVTPFLSLNSINAPCGVSWYSFGNEITTGSFKCQVSGTYQYYYFGHAGEFWHHIVLKLNNTYHINIPPYSDYTGSVKFSGTFNAKIGDIVSISMQPYCGNGLCCVYKIS